jgi:hypothetical protein
MSDSKKHIWLIRPSQIRNRTKRSSFPTIGKGNCKRKTKHQIGVRHFGLVRC